MRKALVLQIALVSCCLFAAGCSSAPGEATEAESKASMEESMALDTMAETQVDGSADAGAAEAGATEADAADAGEAAPTP